MGLASLFIIIAVDIIHAYYGLKCSIIASSSTKCNCTVEYKLCTIKLLYVYYTIAAIIF